MVGRNGFTLTPIARLRSAAAARWLALALLATPVAAVPTPAEGAAPGPVVGTPAGEFQPARGPGHLAWEQNTRTRPGHYDVYARANGGRPFKVNAPGTGAANGGISGTKLVFQQFSGNRSDIKYMNLQNRNRWSASTRVNTPKGWEYWPSLAGPRLLFGRFHVRSGVRAVLLYHTASRTTRTLARTRSRRFFLAPGQVNGNYAVWSRCSPSRCDVWRFNALTKATIKVPNPGVSQHSPAVTRTGVVYFARSRSTRCGSDTKLMRYLPGSSPARRLQLPDGVEIGDVYAYSDALGNTEVLYDRYRCGTRTSADIYRITSARKVTLRVTVAGDGRVVGSPGAIDCPGVCRAQYRAGTKVTLTAQSGSASFTGWSGACSGTGSCTLTMGASKSVTASFQTQFGLTVTRRGSGGGTVTSDPAGIDCGADCNHSFGEGQKVTLTANPDAGSTFTGWEGDCAGSGTSCEVTMSGARDVVAVFELSRLTVTLEGTGSGSVKSQPTGIDCPGDCQEDYPTGTSVTLTAAPAVGSTFTAWGGDCSGTSPTCTVTMDGARSVRADFQSVP